MNAIRQYLHAMGDHHLRTLVRLRDARHLEPNLVGSEPAIRDLGLRLLRRILRSRQLGKSSMHFGIADGKTARKTARNRPHGLDRGR